MFSEDCGEIWVCEDCYFAREGDGLPDRATDLPREWSLIGFGYTVSLGGEHAEGCPNGPDGPRDTDCDCSTLEMSWAACEGCGDNRGGKRERYTVWRMTVSEARNEFDRVMANARQSHNGSDVHRSYGFGSLHAASLWRRYIADRFADTHEFERWIANRTVV